MCNSVCVGIGEFVWPLALAWAAFMIMGMIFAAIGNEWRRSRDEARMMRAAEKRRKYEFELHKMPLEALEEAAEKATRAGGYKCSDGRPIESEILRKRRQVGDHPDARLFPDGASKLYDLDTARRITEFGRQNGHDYTYWRDQVAKLEAEFALARAAAKRREAIAAFWRRVGWQLRFYEAWR